MTYGCCRSSILCYNIFYTWKIVFINTFPPVKLRLLTESDKLNCDFTSRLNTINNQEMSNEIRCETGVILQLRSRRLLTFMS